jgi:hypothetical protein
VREPRSHFAFALLIAAAAACAAHHSAPVDPRGEFALSIINHHWLDVTIYVAHNGERTRVGTVTASSNERFLLSGRLLGATREVYLVGHAVGSLEVIRTEVLLVQPGQVIEWTLENPLRRSSVGVF